MPPRYPDSHWGNSALQYKTLYSPNMIFDESVEKIEHKDKQTEGVKTSNQNISHEKQQDS